MSFPALGNHMICIYLFIGEIKTESYEIVLLKGVAGMSHGACVRGPSGIAG